MSNETVKELSQFLKDRNEALLSGDVEKVRAFVKKHGIGGDGRGAEDRDAPGPDPLEGVPAGDGAGERVVAAGQRVQPGHGVLGNQLTSSVTLTGDTFPTGEGLTGRNTKERGGDL